ncbi:MAG TPA: type II toxin-antitoxin system PemK/MazF family toxin [Ilumatobacter sp.]|nr:type II toxin-antitoxin system PemK/MazF family toxin [Ilumatobacter sp.]
MIAQGDIVVADLGGETREFALVVSNIRFHRLAERALVAPEIRVQQTTTRQPWHIAIDGRVFALDALQSIRVERALEQAGRAGTSQLATLRTALMRIL